MTAERYYVRRPTGKVFGPFDKNAIQLMLKSNKLDANAEVSQDKNTWQSLSDVPDFAQHIRSAGAPGGTIMGMAAVTMEDLPGKVGANPGGFADLPRPASGADLPRPAASGAGFGDLPRPAGAPDLPRPASGAGLPRPPLRRQNGYNAGGKANRPRGKRTHAFQSAASVERTRLQPFPGRPGRHFRLGPWVSP